MTDFTHQTFLLAAVAVVLAVAARLAHLAQAAAVGPVVRTIGNPQNCSKAKKFIARLALAVQARRV